MHPAHGSGSINPSWPDIPYRWPCWGCLWSELPDTQPSEPSLRGPWASPSGILPPCPTAMRHVPWVLHHRFEGDRAIGHGMTQTMTGKAASRGGGGHDYWMENYLDLISALGRGSINAFIGWSVGQFLAPQAVQRNLFSMRGIGVVGRSGSLPMSNSALCPHRHHTRSKIPDFAMSPTVTGPFIGRKIVLNGGRRMASAELHTMMMPRRIAAVAPGTLHHRKWGLDDVEDEYQFPESGALIWIRRRSAQD